ncbi:hypothetical protein psal_cds_792 [Pandoravirus salinus]|uniref:Uncharacterized protein n=1 Tax=Pandoravirus salinus TaxID=1349410 RepID=A0A291ATK7_9VIRU|nr:hypothetical protein psal_cds_792 [Pandoravirus salinus]ATE82232.1 hypothetical protein psal_cds_792 [Pandoravirus salinus]
MSKFYIVGPGPKGPVSTSEDQHAIVVTYNAIRDRRKKLAQRHRPRRDTVDNKSCACLARLCAWMARSEDETLVAEERLALVSARIVEQAQDFVGQFEATGRPKRSSTWSNSLVFRRITTPPTTLRWPCFATSCADRGSGTGPRARPQDPCCPLLSRSKTCVASSAEPMRPPRQQATSRKKRWQNADHLIAFSLFPVFVATKTKMV